MLVTNINGTKDHSCKCGTWLDHWARFGGGSLPRLCSVVNCFQLATDGAHVKKSGVLGLVDGAWYIAPLCRQHNLSTLTSLNVGEAPLVSANVQDTCGNILASLFSGR